MTRTSFVVLALLGFAGTAYAAPQAPHDFAHGVTCNSCHIPYGGLGDPSHFLSGSGDQAATSLTVPGAAWAPGGWVGGVVTFTSGANRSQHRTITANDATSVSWSAAEPLTPAAGVSFQLNKLTYDDVEVKCKACHNPTGVASGDVGLHFTGSGGVVGCGKCHEPHNVEPNSGWSGGNPAGGGLVRAEIRLPTGGTTPVIYNPADGPGRFVTPAGRGVCQACHTKTAYYRNDGSLQTHQVGQSCTSCHLHEIGFGGGATGSAHLRVTDLAWSEQNPWSGACVRCHTDGGFKDYIGFGDATPNYLEGSFLANGTSYPATALNCTSCHNSVADPNGAGLSSVLFVSLARVDGLDHTTALCSQCHQGRESTPSVNSKIASNVASASRGLTYASTSANAAGTTTTIVRTGAGWTASQFKGYTLLFTNGPNQGQQRTVADNDATTITLNAALSTATASGNSFTLWPTATGGTGDSNAAKGVTMPNVTRGIDLVDTNRSWTANQWQNFYLYVQTDGANNAGLYRVITGNTATTLTVANAALSSGMPFPSVIPAGSIYQIIPKEDTAVLDAIASSISFSNVHYLPASATLHGSAARVGYQNPSNWANGAQRVAANTSYAGKNLHGVSQGSCASCHNPHTLEITVTSATCGRCHFNEDGTPVNGMAQLEEARQFGFQGDIDGNNQEQSLKAEIGGLAALLYQAIRNYGGANIGGTTHPICYTAASNPYFFKDNGLGGGVAGNGVCEAGEAVSANAYGASGAGWFTPRLLRAAFDYQYYVKDPGAWAHNPRYVIELLYDALRDLNLALPSNQTAAAGGQVGYICLNSASDARISGGVVQQSPTVPADVAAMNGDGTCPTGYTKVLGAMRSFKAGHFAGMTGAFRSRDTTVNTAGMWGYPCLRCHAGESGLEQYLAQPTFLDNAAPYAAAVASPQGMQCTTCHDPLPTDGDMKRMRNIGATAIGGVRFPGHSASGNILGDSYQTILGVASFGDPSDMICSSCHDGRDINGRMFEKFLDGTWSGFDVPGSPFYGSGTIGNNGAGGIRISGLPLYQPAIPKGTPNNWLYTTSCQAVGKYITISGASYNGTFAITSCGNGTADLAVAYVGDDSVSWAAWVASTKNTHDIQSAVRVYGSDAHGGYEYAGKTYAGRAQHHGATASCMECHSPVRTKHTMEVPEAVAAGACAPCHTGTAYTTWSAPARGLTTGSGYDGDAATQTLSDELISFRRGLAAAMNAYQRAAGAMQAGGNICWSDASSAFRTEAGNITGWCVSSTTSWSTYDPRLARAGFNMLWASNTYDPGGWAHNFNYLAQLMYDSAQDLNGGAPPTYVNGASTFTLIRP